MAWGGERHLCAQRLVSLEALKKQLKGGGPRKMALHTSMGTLMFGWGGGGGGGLGGGGGEPSNACEGKGA